MVEQTLKELKTIYESSVKPLEDLYAYKELSNRHFGDPEIFAKPLVVLMGPWSGGKSTMINYLLGTEYTKNAFKSGEPCQSKKQKGIKQAFFGDYFASKWIFRIREFRKSLGLEGKSLIFG